MSGNTYTTTVSNVWEGDGYYDALAFARIGAAWRYPLFDGLGSTRQLLDGSQNVTDTYQYEAFGNSMGSTGSTANPYRYVGSLGYYQTGSSLMHLGARYYLPEVGRFLQRDARIEANRYLYVSNSPALEVDPTGLYSIVGAIGPIRDRIKRAADDLCSRLPATATPELTACTYPLQDMVLSGLRAFCSEGTIVYEGLSTWPCRRGAYGWAPAWGHTIHLCLPALAPYALGPTILHEIVHTLGYPWEGVPNAVMCCFYPEVAG